MLQERQLPVQYESTDGQAPIRTLSTYDARVECQSRRPEHAPAVARRAVETIDNLAVRRRLIPENCYRLACMHLRGGTSLGCRKFGTPIPVRLLAPKAPR